MRHKNGEIRAGPQFIAVGDQKIPILLTPNFSKATAGRSITVNR